MENNEKRKIISQIKYKLSLTISMTFIVVLAAIAVSLTNTFIKGLVLFFGLEGTMLMAMGISPSWEATFDKPECFRRKIWYFMEIGVSRGVSVKYNPIFFYSGLLCLSLSMVVDALF